MRTKDIGSQRSLSARVSRNPFRPLWCREMRMVQVPPVPNHRQSPYEGDDLMSIVHDLNLRRFDENQRIFFNRFEGKKICRRRRSRDAEQEPHKDHPCQFHRHSSFGVGGRNVARTKHLIVIELRYRQRLTNGHQLLSTPSPRPPRPIPRRRNFN